jgi:large subunit ribosomal protein L24
MIREGQKSTKLRKDDVVKIIKGKDGGKQGRILRIDRQKQRVIVEGLNIIKKAMKPKKQNEKGGIKELEAPVSMGNVMIICKKCGPTRIGFKMSSETKSRICRKCGEQL